MENAKYWGGGGGCRLGKGQDNTLDVLMLLQETICVLQTSCVADY